MDAHRIDDMRILYDGMVYELQAAGGVNRYFKSLIARLPSDVSPYLITRRPLDVSLPVHPKLRSYRHRSLRPGRVFYKLEKLLSRSFDIAHPTYYSLLTQWTISDYRCPVVLTVWDMIHELFHQHDPHGQTAELKRKAIQSAQVVICISENTKKDLQELYAVPDSRIKVTHLASDIDATLSYGPEPVPPRPYFLYVGVRYKYKNFDGLLRAFANVLSSQPEIALCVVGPSFDATELKLIANLGVTDSIVHYGHISDAHLAKLYRRSIAFVYPSLYEGFGIPPLEAMSCGTAVVASNRSSIPEVVGDAALLFDPTSNDDLADILLLLLHDEGERGRMIERGRHRANMFSWDKTAAQTLEIYRSVSRRSDQFRQPATPAVRVA